MQTGLRLLLEAYRCAQNLGQDLWNFSLDMPALHQAGLTDTQLRWLICQGCLCHARETTRARSRRRTFRLIPNLKLDACSCFTLTSRGVQLAQAVLDPEELAGRHEGAGEPIPSVSHFTKATCLTYPRALTPSWWADERELRCGTQLVKKFRRRADNQISILVAFEACALAFLDSFEWPVTFVQFVRVVQASSRLQQYRREVYARHAQALAACVRQEDPTLDAVTAARLALALMGVAVAASENLGQRVMAGQALRRAARATRTDAERAFALLGRGLADFGVQEPIAARGRRAR